MIANTLRKIKRLVKISIGKDYYTSLDVKIRNVKLGSKHCGWNVAVDYLKNDLNVLSFGLGEDISFDFVLAYEYKSMVHGFDPTPKSIAWVKSQDLPDSFVLHEYGLADFNGTIEFYPPENPNHISYTTVNRPAFSNSSTDSIKVPVKTISTIMNDLQLKRIDILKMDIEGSEYGVLNDLLVTDIRPKQLLVEFHHRFPEIGMVKTKNIIFQLRNEGYRVFSISGNAEEYSFIYDPDKTL
jgi:FkbM family methyltransferase